jgi:hypothetical protein
MCALLVISKLSQDVTEVDGGKMEVELDVITHVEALTRANGGEAATGGEPKK